MRIVQISDTHLSHLGGIPTRNLQRLITFINEELRPDLVVHSGDVLILDPDSAADRHAARDLLDQISAPLRVVPGNHDVGEPGDRPWGGLGVTSTRVTAFAGVFGPGTGWRPSVVTPSSGSAARSCPVACPRSRPSGTGWKRSLRRSVTARC
jgi:hypothetical protein